MVLLVKARNRILSLSLSCLSGLIRRFALFNLCDLNPTSWAASVAQLEEHQLGCLGGSVGRATALKAGGCGFESHLSSLFSMKIEK